MQTPFNINPFDRDLNYIPDKGILSMKVKLLFCMLSILTFVFVFGCSKSAPISQKLAQDEQAPVSNKSSGATQISGIGFFATPAECDAASQGADYAVRMTGDLAGCLYVFIDDFNCSPSGTYREEGREYFVGTYKGNAGTFWTDYKFEAKYEGCAANGAPLGAEIFGRCQHPVVKGSGTGVFNGVTGRLDMKDDIEAGNFPYRGHLQY
jgi:hypothetical protein